jgi:hypothetical protein
MPGFYNSSQKNYREWSTLFLIPVAALIRLGSAVDLVRPARKVKRGSSVYYGPASKSCGFSERLIVLSQTHPSSAAPTPPSVVIGPGDLVPGLPPQPYIDTTSEEGSTIPGVHLLIPSASSRWSLLTKKSKQKLKKVSSSLFASSNSFSNPHEKVSVRTVPFWGTNS